MTNQIVTKVAAASAQTEIANSERTAPALSQNPRKMPPVATNQTIAELGVFTPKLSRHKRYSIFILLNLSCITMTLRLCRYYKEQLVSDPNTLSG